MRYDRGFTIIETSLFLAISGLLAVGLLAGTGAAVNSQRYTDSVGSLETFISSEYARLDSVQNDKQSTQSCGSGSAAVTDNGTAIDRGQTDCLIIGRFMYINQGNIVSYPVLAYQTSNGSYSNDLATLYNNYDVRINPSDATTESLRWGAVISWPRSGDGSRLPTTPRSISILLIKSPDSGAVYTLSTSGDQTASVRSMISSSYFGEIRLCVDSQGLLSNNSTRSIDIASNAHNVDAVNILSNDLILNGGTKC